MSPPTATSEDENRTATDVGGVVVRTTLAEGTVLAGRYRVQRLIGEGGMGDVYLATHLRIDKPVAIKVLAPEQMRRPRTVSRFLQEAKAASKIRHDNVVDITDFGEAEGCAFFVMEFLDGEDLDHLLKREKRIEWPRARAIAIQLLGGLGAAHDAGIIHRDIKPHNCFISPHDNVAEFVKVIDFGIAKLAEGSEEQLTRTGAIMGTAEYMSPEQGQGLELDARADLYSVGVILYRMLTGDVPYRGGNPMAVLYQHIHGQLVVPSQACPEAGLTEEIDAIVTKALAKDRDQRFSSAAEFIGALREIDDAGASTTARPVAARSAVPMPLMLGLGALLAIGAGWWLYGMLAPAPDADPGAADATATVAAAPTTPAPMPEAAPATGPDDDAPAPTEPVAAGPAVVVETEASAGPDGAEVGSTSAAPDEPDDEQTEPAAESAVPARRSSRRLNTAFDKVSDKVRSCAKKAGLFPGEKVSVEAKIAPSGKVTGVDVKGAHAKAGRACIVDAVKRAKFGEAQKPQSASHRYSI